MSVAALLPDVVRRELPALSSAVSSETARLAPSDGSASEADLARVLTRLDGLPRPWLDAVATFFGVDFYDAELPDAGVLALVRGAAEWHRRRGTRWALAWALGVLGLGHAEILEAADIEALPRGYDVLDGAHRLDEDPPRTLGRRTLDTDLPLDLSWAEYVVRLDLDDEQTGAAWGPQLARAVELASPASRRAHFVLTFDGANEHRYRGALYEARLALGAGYAYSTLPTLGGVPLDGSWSLTPTAILARRRDDPASGARGPDAKTAPERVDLAEAVLADGARYTAEDRGDGTAVLRGPMAVVERDVTWRGQTYRLRRARLTSYPAVRALSRDGNSISIPTA